MLIIGRDNGVLITIVPVAVPVAVTAPVATTEGAGDGEYDAPPGHDDTTIGGGVHVGSVI